MYTSKKLLKNELRSPHIILPVKYINILNKNVLWFHLKECENVQVVRIIMPMIAIHVHHPMSALLNHLRLPSVPRLVNIN